MKKVGLFTLLVGGVIMTMPTFADFMPENHRPVHRCLQIMENRELAQQENAKLFTEITPVSAGSEKQVETLIYKTCLDGGYKFNRFKLVYELEGKQYPIETPRVHSYSVENSNPLKYDDEIMVVEKTQTGYALRTIFAQTRDYNGKIIETKIDERAKWENSQRFSDVNTNHIYAKEIEELAKMGIISGFPDGTFRPSQSLTRAELTKILIQYGGTTQDELQACKNKKNFSDVKATDWFAPYVCMASKLNKVKGYPDGTFKPNDKVSRAHAAKIVVLSKSKQDAYTEANPWYREYMDALNNAQNLDATLKNRDPNATINRGELATLFITLSSSELK